MSETRIIFDKKEVQEIIKNHLLELGYKLSFCNYEVGSYELKSITCTVSPIKATKTFTVNVGQLSKEEAQLQLTHIINTYKNLVNIDNLISEKQIKSNEN